MLLRGDIHAIFRDGKLLPRRIMIYHDKSNLSRVSREISVTSDLFGNREGSFVRRIGAPLSNHDRRLDVTS